MVGGERVWAARTVSARDLLNELPVTVEYVGGYDRARFGGWLDSDHDGCDTRREVLIAEAIRAPRVGVGCDLGGGMWKSKWDGQVIKDASGLQIDHVVPLSEVWKSGGYAWSQTRRKAYANDLAYPGTLLAVSAHSNMSKGDRSPGQWTPTSAGARCWFVGDWIAVKWRWNLAVDSFEKAELGGLLNYCQRTGQSTGVTRPRRV